MSPHFVGATPHSVECSTSGPSASSMTCLEETMTDFALHITENSYGPVVLLKGDLDLNAVPQLAQCLKDRSSQAVALDFSDVTFIDTTAIGVLVDAYNRAADEGGSLVLHGVEPAQMTVFRSGGVANYVDLYGDDAAPL
jgi:anti-sigma B factor antagonist